MKILITQACAAPAMEGSDHHDANTIADLAPDIARAIVQAGKGLYVDPKDDPSKIKGATAPEARIEAVRAAHKAAARAAKKSEGEAPSPSPPPAP